MAHLLWPFGTCFFLIKLYYVYRKCDFQSHKVLILVATPKKNVEMEVLYKPLYDCYFL